MNPLKDRREKNKEVLNAQDGPSTPPGMVAPSMPGIFPNIPAPSTTMEESGAILPPTVTPTQEVVIPPPVEQPKQVIAPPTIPVTPVEAPVSQEVPFSSDPVAPVAEAPVVTPPTVSVPAPPVAPVEEVKENPPVVLQEKHLEKPKPKTNVVPKVAPTMDLFASMAPAAPVEEVKEEVAPEVVKQPVVVEEEKPVNVPTPTVNAPVEVITPPVVVAPVEVKVEPAIEVIAPKVVVTEPSVAPTNPVISSPPVLGVNDGIIPPPPSMGVQAPAPDTNTLKEVITTPQPIKEGASSTPRTMFAWNTSKPMTDAQKAIIESGKTPDQLSPEELREVYFHISAIPGRKMYSATTITFIEKNGVHPDDAPREENEYLFFGTEVHSAMETKGESLKRLQCYGDIGEMPVKPEGIKLSTDHQSIIYEIAVKQRTPAQAYQAVKDTVATKAITMDMLMDYEVNSTIYDHEDPKSDEGKILDKKKKAVEKIIKSGKTEFEKIKPHLNTYGKYLIEMEKWDIKKDELKSKGGFIIDELPYISSGGAAGKRIRDRIQACYGSLASNREVMDIYYMEDKNPELESYIEFPILWQFKAGSRIVPAKSMIDKIQFDFKNKTVYIQDIKTHGRKSHEFLSMNYVGHKYYRSMSFYTEAVKYYLTKHRGIVDIDEWKFINILLPVSSISYEVGCFTPVVSVSNIDIQVGKFGGFHKVNGQTLFAENEPGVVQYMLDQDGFNKLKSIGFLHENAVDYKVKGWIEVATNFEKQFKPLNVR